MTHHLLQPVGHNQNCHFAGKCRAPISFCQAEQHLSHFPAWTCSLQCPMHTKSPLQPLNGVTMLYAWCFTAKHLKSNHFALLLVMRHVNIQMSGIRVLLQSTAEISTCTALLGPGHNAEEHCVSYRNLSETNNKNSHKSPNITTLAAEKPPR